MAAVTINNSVFKFLEDFEKNLLFLKDHKELTSDDSTYKNIKKSWTERQLEDVLTAGYEFLDKFKKFLQTGDYTNKESDYKLVELYFQGLKDSEIVNELSLKNNNSLRSKRSRLTAKVYARLFNQKTVPIALRQLKDLESINYYISLLTSAKAKISFEDIMLAGTHSAIRDAIKDIKPDGRLSDSEYSLALRLVAMYSKQEFERAINGVEPRALAYVLKELKSAKSNKTSIAYNSLSSVFLSSVDEFKDSSLSMVRAFENKDSDYIATNKSDDWKKLKEKEDRLSAKEAELEKLEADINKKLLNYNNLKKFICKSFGVDSIAEFKTLVETAENFDIPVEYIKIAMTYKKKYDYELSNPDNRFKNYQGDLSITSDTRELVRKLFANITLSNFVDKLSTLNPYNVATMLDSKK